MDLLSRLQDAGQPHSPPVHVGDPHWRFENPDRSSGAQASFQDLQENAVALLQDDMKTALKAGQKDRLQVIRMLLSDVKNIDLMPGKPTAQQAVEAYTKKLRKSLEEYQKLGKAAEVTALQFEIGVAEEYLPKKLSAEDTEKLVEQFLASNAFTEKQTGQATGMFMKAHGSQVEHGIASAAIRKRLAGK